MMKLEGELGEINVVDRLVELGRESFTGAVRFENDGIIKIIYFKSGDVLSASTNDRADSVDEILLRAGKVGRDHIKQALAKRKENETLGDALLNLGFITRKELTWARRMQAIGVIRSVAEWSAGSYTIVADYLPKREEGTQFPLSQMIVEMIVTDPDRVKIEQALEAGNIVFEKAPDFNHEFGRIGLNQDAEEVTRHVDGVKSAGEIAASSGKDEFNVYKLLHALAILGLVRRAGEAAAAEPQVVPQQSFGSFDDFSFETAAVADADEAWSAPAPEAGGLSFGTAEEPPTEAMPAMMSFGASEPLDRPALDTPPPEPAMAAPVAPAASIPTSFESPLWDEEPQIPQATAPEPVHTEPEERWGFDEAQIETARRASVPVSAGETIRPSAPTLNRRKPKSRRPSGLIIALAAIVLLAAAGWGGWMWWQQRAAQQQADLAPVTPRPRRPRPVTPDANALPATDTTATLVPVTDSGTGTAATTTTATTSAPVAPTTTVAPPPASTAKAPTGVPTQPAVASRPTPTTVTPRVERGTTGAPVITNTAPGGAVASDATRAHYDEMARTFASQATGSYTIQFELVCETASITRAIKGGGTNVWFVPISYRGKGCYRVFWGRYGSRAEAESALASIPGALREGNKPVVVTVPK